MVLEYLYTTVQIFSVPVIKETSQCAPAPNRGQGWRKGVIITLKRGFLQNRIFFCEVNDIKPLYGSGRRLPNHYLLKAV